MHTGLASNLLLQLRVLVLSGRDAIQCLLPADLNEFRLRISVGLASELHSCASPTTAHLPRHLLSPVAGPGSNAQTYHSVARLLGRTQAYRLATGTGPFAGRLSTPMPQEGCASLTGSRSTACRLAATTTPRTSTSAWKAAAAFGNP